MQLDTCTKNKVHHLVRSCAFDLNGMSTSSHLNVLSLGSSNMLLGMDYLYIHRTKVDYYDRATEFLDDDGENRILQGKKKTISMSMVTIV